jgi:6-phosphogluconolactonase/glucosamine-6-phosphate isomerase/deaminase
LTALRVLPPASWAGAVVGAFVERLRTTPSLRVCLPTGATPVPAYEALVGRVERGDASFAGATVILLDEWVGLPPGDPARCDIRLRAQLVERLLVPPVAVHTIDVEASDLDAAAARHAAISSDLDLVVLGLGMNGHVGFNEPGSRPDSPTRLVRLAASSGDAAVARYGAPRVPTAGITLGMDRILAAGEAWLLVTGDRKAHILRRALRDPEGPDCPASYLRRHPNLRVFADEAAATLLA